MTFNTVKRMTVPCESAVWYTIPTIRRELAIVMIRDLKMPQRDVARKLGITDAAISQYMHAKRGQKKRLNAEAKKLIRQIARRLVRGDLAADDAVCSICRMLRGELDEGIS